MTSSETRRQLSLVEAKLFASTEIAVIHALDASDDLQQARAQLQDLGMTESEASSVLEMPLRNRVRSERRVLLREAERLRGHDDPSP